MILTVTGASGSGKSSLIRLILSLLPNAKQGASYSTRPARMADPNTELKSISLSEFHQGVEQNDFLWTVEVYGYRYGTTKQTFIDGLAAQESWTVLDVVPIAMPAIAAAALEAGFPDRLRSIYVLSPDLRVLQARLLARGESLESMRMRTAQCADWDNQARQSSLYGLFVPGFGDLNKNARTVINYLIQSSK